MSALIASMKNALHMPATVPRWSVLLVLLTLAVMSAAAQAKYQINDGGALRNLELAEDEAMLIFPSGSSRDLKSVISTQVSGVTVIEARGSSALVRTAKPLERKKAIRKQDELSMGMPGVEVFPVLYVQGVRDVRSRRIATHELLLEVKDQTPAEAARIAMQKTGAKSWKSTRAKGVILVTFDSPWSALEGAVGLRAAGYSADPILKRQQQPRAILPNDPFFGQQWHLRNTGQGNGTPGADANVLEAWDTTKGNGVTLAIIDDCLEVAHPDLDANTPSIASGQHHNFNNGPSNDPSPDNSNGDAHGTSVGGVAAARQNNNLGVSGAAPETKLLGLRLIAGPSSDADEAAAFLWQPGITVHATNNSWGPYDGSGVYGPGVLARQALVDAAEQGRGGLGTITIFAAGNGKGVDDNSNYDGYANARHVIAVGAVDNTGKSSYYSEPGANILVCAPSNGGSLGIFTTDVTGSGGYNPGAGQPSNKDYTNSFGGTSSASPLTAGVVSLVLSANPLLGWRDVHEIMATTARKNHASSSDWIENEAGFKFHHNYGGGMVDASAAVRRAMTWNNLPSEEEVTRTATITGGSESIPEVTNSMLTKNFDFSTSNNIRVEHVEVTLDIRHNRRSDLDIRIVSPGGTTSRLAEKHVATYYDFDHDYTGLNGGWTFTSTHHWGENSQGTWQVQIFDKRTGTTGTLRAAKVGLFGIPANKTRVRFAQQRYSSLENAASITVRVDRVGESGAFTVDYTTVPSSATVDADYTTVSGTLSFDADEQFKEITIPLLDDLDIESTERFSVVLQNPVGVTFGGISLTTVELADDESNLVSVTATDAVATEILGGGSGDSGAFVISRSQATIDPLVVYFEITGSATEGADFSTMSRQVTIPGGSTSSALIFVNPIDDANTEGAETVELTLLPDVDYGIGAPPSATVVLFDDAADRPKVDITAPDNSASEAGDTGTLRLTRSNGPTTLPLIVDLDVTGAAIPGVNYIELPEQVEIPAGETTVDLTVTAKNDGKYHPTQTIQVNLGESSEYAMGAQTRADVSIVHIDPIPDSVLPVLKIVSPANKVRINDPETVTASGTATDNLQELQRVLYRLNGGVWKLANLSGTAWDADITADLAPGPNLLEVLAEDNDENLSKMQSRPFTYVQTHTLSVSSATGGRVSPGFQPSSIREAGQVYKITAIPDKGFVFNGWSGDLEFNGRSFTFTMPDVDTTIAANFAATPFGGGIAGNYSGLVRATTFDTTTSGFLKITLTQNGTFTGKLTFNGVILPVKGEFTGDGSYKGTVLRKNTSPLVLDLTLDVVANATDRITGTIGNDEFTCAVVADRAVYHAKLNPAPAALVKSYTMIIPPDSESLHPRGYGFATVKIANTGVVKLVGMMPDGNKLSLSASITKANTWPLFQVMYKGKGVVIGEITHADETESDLNGVINWKKLPLITDRYYSSGFTVEGIAPYGSIYMDRGKNMRAIASLDAANGAADAILLSGNLTSQLTKSVVFNTKNVAVIPDFKLSINAKTGVIKGSFKHPSTSKITVINGAVSQKSNEGFGVFLGSNPFNSGLQSGSLKLDVD